MIARCKINFLILSYLSKKICVSTQRSTLKNILVLCQNHTNTIPIISETGRAIIQPIPFSQRRYPPIENVIIKGAYPHMILKKKAPRKNIMGRSITPMIIRIVVMLMIFCKLHIVRYLWRRHFSAAQAIYHRPLAL